MQLNQFYTVMARPRNLTMDKEATQELELTSAETQDSNLNYGNLDKNQEHELPEKFDAKNFYFVKMWKTVRVPDGRLIEDNRTIKCQVFDELNFDALFGTIVDRSGNESVPVAQKLGFKFKVLHNPNKK